MIKSNMKTSFFRDMIEKWLISKIVQITGLPHKEIDFSKPFRFYGLDSNHIVGLTAELGLQLNRNLPTTLGFDYPNIKSLVSFLFHDENHYIDLPLDHNTVSHDTNNAYFQSSKKESNKDDQEEYSSEPIAVIGLSCRFPGKANTPGEFWKFLKEKGDGIVEVPADRWDIDEYYDENPETPGKMDTRWGGFIDNIDKFDASFFGISPREAISMDPQQRLVLEVCWQALEDAGEMSDKLNGSNTGVFVGISGSDYGRLIFNGRPDLNLYSGTGNSTSIAANRVSYTLGLQGPSIAIDTACSSSLVSVHLACQSLKNRECDMALAGGVNLVLSPEMTIIFSKAKLMAPDGRCKTFDSSADGYVRSEGCGMIVLKRLSDARRDNNTILGLLRGTCINQDGQSNGLTVPNGLSQQALLQNALNNAGIKPSQISYIEAHGTGTMMGDPIEIEAIEKVFSQNRTVDNPVIIGSVKTNIGHLEQAAGIAGLIKVLLSLKNEYIPPHLHFKQVNPKISLDSIPAVIPVDGIAWPTGKKKRFAGVSAFSFGGVNAHVIIGEVPVLPENSSDIERPLHLMTVSAKNNESLQKIASNYSEYLQNNLSMNPGDICFTANTGRAHHNERLAVIADSIDQFKKCMDDFSINVPNKGILRGT